MVSLLAQTSMYTYELAPIGSLIEHEIIKKMCKMSNFTQEGAAGVLTTGGSNGNMLGMLCARQ